MYVQKVCQQDAYPANAGGGAITIRNTLAPFSRATSPSLILYVSIYPTVDYYK